METRADMLRRRIAVYRGYLNQGVDSGLARQYLRAIAEAEGELAKLEAREPQSPGARDEDRPNARVEERFSS